MRKKPLYLSTFTGRPPDEPSILGEALNEIAAIEAQVEGFRSEQKVNAAALQKEEQELISSRLESENNLSIERKRFVAEQIKDERKRLEEQQRVER